jgi:hypothetical protein
VRKRGALAKLELKNFTRLGYRDNLSHIAACAVDRVNVYWA